MFLFGSHHLFYNIQMWVQLLISIEIEKLGGNVILIFRDGCVTCKGNHKFYFLFFIAWIDEETDDEHIQSCRQQVAPKPAELPSPPPALPPILLPLPPTLPPLPPTLPPPPPTLPPHPPTLPPHPPTFQLSIRPSSPVPTYEEFEVMGKY